MKDKIQRSNPANVIPNNKTRKTGILTIGDDNYRLVYNDKYGTYTSLDEAKSDLLNYFLNRQA